MTSTIEMVEFLNELLTSGALEVNSGSYSVSKMQEALVSKAQAIKAKAEAAIAAYDAWIDAQAQGYDDSRHMFAPGGSY